MVTVALGYMPDYSGIKQFLQIQFNEIDGKYVETRIDRLYGFVVGTSVQLDELVGASITLGDTRIEKFRGIVASLTDLTFHDGEGIASSIFTKGDKFKGILAPILGSWVGYMEGLNIGGILHNEVSRMKGLLIAPLIGTITSYFEGYQFSIIASEGPAKGNFHQIGLLTNNNYIYSRTNTTGRNEPPLSRDFLNKIRDTIQEYSRNIYFLMPSLELALIPVRA